MDKIVSAVDARLRAGDKVRVTLNLDVADHCMLQWFTPDRVYEGTVKRFYSGGPLGITLTSNEGWVDTYNRKWFNIAPLSDGADVAGYQPDRVASARQDTLAGKVPEVA